jgi:hypothetical protein
MFKWLKEYLEIKYQFKEQQLALQAESLICKSCETLKNQLDIANYEKKQLLESILQSDTHRTASHTQSEASAPQQIKPHSIPWAVRKQMLEAEDRQKARILNENARNDLKFAADITRADSGGIKVIIPNPNPNPNEIEELERELGIGEAK